MKRKVYLVGELGDKFGPAHNIYAETFEDVFKCLDANTEGFRHYLADAQKNNLDISIHVNEEEVTDPTDILLGNLGKGDITIGIIPAGAGGDGFLETLVGVVMMVFMPQFASLTATQAKIAKFLYTTVATNLISKGLQKMMAPDPAEDEDEPTNYLFQGAEQNIIEGDPVPLLYGELIIPGQNIGTYGNAGDTLANPVHKIDANGNIYVSNSGG